jgi:hypothetical protein
MSGPQFWAVAGAFVVAVGLFVIGVGFVGKR